MVQSSTMEYTENTKLVAAPTHRHTFRRHYPATAIPPPGWTRLRWSCKKNCEQRFSFGTTNDWGDGAQKLFLFSPTSSSIMKLRKSAQRASNFPLMQRIIRPFRPPLSHQGKYIIRFEGLRGLFTYQAPRKMMTMMRGTTLQSADIFNPYRRFKFELCTLTKTVAELNFWTTAWTAFCFSSCLPFAKLWQTCWRKECKWWHRMSVITYEWNNALEF